MAEVAAHGVVDAAEEAVEVEVEGVVEEVPQEVQVLRVDVVLEMLLPWFLFRKRMMMRKQPMRTRQGQALDHRLHHPPATKQWVNLL